MNVRKQLSLDRIIFGLTGFIGVMIGLLDYLQVIDWPADRYTKIILLGTGLLMISVVAEAIKREHALERVAEQFGNPAPKYLDMDTEVPGAFERSVREVEQFINEAVLTWTVVSNQDRRDAYRNERDKRLIKREIMLRQLVVIHHKQHFDEILCMLERFRNHDRYELRCYQPAARPMPALSLWSFDNKEVYLGSFYVGLAPGADKMLLIKDPELNAWLVEYWQALWNKAEVIKEGLHIDEAKIKEIQDRLGISNKRFDELVFNARSAAEGQWKNGTLIHRS